MEYWDYPIVASLVIFAKKVYEWISKGSFLDIYKATLGAIKDWGDRNLKKKELLLKSGDSKNNKKEEKSSKIEPVNTKPISKESNKQLSNTISKYAEVSVELATLRIRFDFKRIFMLSLSSGIVDLFDEGMYYFTINEEFTRPNVSPIIQNYSRVPISEIIDWLIEADRYKLWDSTLHDDIKPLSQNNINTIKGIHKFMFINSMTRLISVPLKIDNVLLGVIVIEVDDISIFPDSINIKMTYNEALTDIAHTMHNIEAIYTKYYNLK